MLTNFDKDNINQFTASELRAKCSSANQRLRIFCQDQGYSEYPFILTSRATPRQMRGWLLHHFPSDFYIGKCEIGIIAGHHVYRGVEHTSNGFFSDGIAGMKKF